MALFRSLDSRHTLRVPLALLGYITELTQGEGSTCDVMVSCDVISLFVSITSLASVGYYIHVVHRWDAGIKYSRVFTWYIAYLVEGIWEHAL